MSFFDPIFITKLIFDMLIYVDMLSYIFDIFDIFITKLICHSGELFRLAMGWPGSYMDS